MSVADCPVYGLTENRNSFDICVFSYQILYNADMIMIRGYVQGRNLSLFALIRRAVQFFYKIFNQLKMTMLNSCEKGTVSLLISDWRVQT